MSAILNTPSFELENTIGSGNRLIEWGQTLKLLQLSVDDNTLSYCAHGWDMIMK